METCNCLQCVANDMAMQIIPQSSGNSALSTLAGDIFDYSMGTKTAAELIAKIDQYQKIADTYPTDHNQVPKIEQQIAGLREKLEAENHEVKNNC